MPYISLSQQAIGQKYSPLDVGRGTYAPLSTKGVVPQLGQPKIFAEPNTVKLSDGQTTQSRHFFQPKFLQTKEDEFWGKRWAKGLVNFVISPIVPLGEDIGQIIALHEITKGVAEGKYPVSLLDEFDVLNKTSPQIVGDVAQSVIMAIPFGRLAKVSTKSLPLLSKMFLGAKEGALIGGAFGMAGTLSEEAHPTFRQILTGGAIGTAVGTGVGAISIPAIEGIKGFIQALRGKIPEIPIVSLLKKKKVEVPKPTFVQKMFPQLYEKRLNEIAVKELPYEAFINTPKLNAFESLMKPGTPIRALTAKDPAASKIRIDLENSVLAQKNRYNRLFDKNWDTLKKYSDSARSQIVALQEKGVKTAKNKALQPGLNALRELEKKGLEMAQILGANTGKWRFTSSNHFAHTWRGEQVIFDQLPDKTRKIVGFAKNRVDGLRKLLEYQERNPKSTPIMRPREEIWKSSQPVTALSQKGYWSFIKRVSDILEMTPREAAEEISMQGIASIKPRRTKIGVFKYRKGEIGDYMTDPLKVYPSLWWKMTKAIELDKTLRNSALRLNKIQNSEIRQVVSDLIDVLSGKFDRQVLNYGMTAKITGIQAQMKLGFRISPALVNLFQRLYAVALTGEKNFVRASKNIFTKEGQRILEKIGVSVDVPLYETVGRQITRKWYSPMFIFGQTEGGKYIGNRNIVGLAAWYRGLELDIGPINRNLAKIKFPKFKSQEDLALNYARQSVHATQFVYDTVGAPALMRSNLGKVALQFKTYGINQITNTYYVIQGKPLPGMELFFPGGLSRSQQVHQAIIHFGTLFSQGGLRSLSWGMERFLPPAILTWMALKAPWLLYGVTAFLGLDISRSSTVELSNLTNILPYEDAKKVWKAVSEKNPEHLLGINPAAYRIYRALEASTQEGWLQEFGRETERNIIQLTPIELFAYGAGINPLRVTQEQDLHWQIVRERTELNEIAAKGKRDIIKALQARDFDLVTNIYQKLLSQGIEVRPQDILKTITEDELSRIQRDFLRERKSRREEFIKQYKPFLVPAK